MTLKLNNRLEVLSDSDSFEFTDVVDKDPDYNVDENDRPSFPNKTEPHKRLVLYTSSSESESEYSTGTPSLVSFVNLVGPVNLSLIHI